MHAVREYEQAAARSLLPTTPIHQRTLIFVARLCRRRACNVRTTCNHHNTSRYLFGAENSTYTRVERVQRDTRNNNTHAHAYAHAHAHTHTQAHTHRRTARPSDTDRPTDRQRQTRCSSSARDGDHERPPSSNRAHTAHHRTRTAAATTTRRAMRLSRRPCMHVCM